MLEEGLKSLERPAFAQSATDRVQLVSVGIGEFILCIAVRGSCALEFIDRVAHNERA